MKLADPYGLFNGEIHALFNDSRLNLIALSLDNKYSCQSSYFFNHISPKLNDSVLVGPELHLLKKWGSTSSIFEKDKKLFGNIGGGFFIFNNGFGLAIDPGQDFLSNLTMDSDFDLMDIDGIICTHPHYDHIADLQKILLGKLEYNRFAGYRPLYYLLPHPDDYSYFHPNSLNLKEFIDIRSSNHSRSQKQNRYFIPNTKWGEKNGFKVQCIEVRHKIHKDRTESHAFLIEPLKEGKSIMRILFSGDVEYSRDLFCEFQSDICILNSSSVRFGDIAHLKLEPDNRLENKIKNNHLGYAGVVSVLKTQSCKIAFIDESFHGQSEADARLAIARAIGSEPGIINRNISVFTCESGIRISCSNPNHPALFCTPFCSGNGFVDFNNNLSQHQPSLYNRMSSICFACPECLDLKRRMGRSLCFPA